MNISIFGVVFAGCDLLGWLHPTFEMVMDMRYLALILALFSPLAFAADPAPGAQPAGNVKKVEAPAKKDPALARADKAEAPAKDEFAAAKAALLDALDFRRKMEAKVYLSRKNILDTTTECVRKAAKVDAVTQCNELERKQAFDSVHDTQKLLTEFGKKMDKARHALGLPEPLSPQEAAMKAEMAKTNRINQAPKN